MYFFLSKYTYATEAGIKKNQIEKRNELIKFLHENSLKANIAKQLIVDLALERTAARAIVGDRIRKAS